MFDKVHHVNYVVTSIDEIAEYLKKYFDLKPLGVAEPPGWGFRSLIYKVGETLLEFAEPFVDERGEAIVQREPATRFAKILRETGPGLFHVAYGVNGIDQMFQDLKGKGIIKFMQGEHPTTVHQSLVGGYKVFNIDPSHVGPAFAKAESGVFFQLAEGAVIPMPGWRPN